MSSAAGMSSTRISAAVPVVARMPRMMRQDVCSGLSSSNASRSLRIGWAVRV
jgi:hypothetical protein